MVRGTPDLNTVVLSAEGQDWQEDQKLLGFELEALTFGFVHPGSQYKGFEADHIYSVLTANSRLSEDWIEDGIKNKWREGIQNNQKNFGDRAEIRIEDGWETLYVDGERRFFNGQRPRFESISRTRNGEGIIFQLSADTYAAHDFLKTTILPKQYQARLHTMNGIVLTSDGYTISGIRSGLVDQSGEEHILPAGFINPIPLPKTDEAADNPIKTALERFYKEFTINAPYASELPTTAAQRVIGRELAVNGDYKIENMLTASPRLIGIVDNSYRNKDITASIILETNAPSSAFSPGPARESYDLIFTPTDHDSLTRKIATLATSPEKSSGHLRGDLALLIGYLYGADGFREGMSQAAKYVARFKQ